MTRSLFTFLALGLLGSATVGQDVSNCPVLSVMGPPGIIAAGEIATYTVDSTSPIEGLRLQYAWSVSAGIIKSGQGTRQVKVIRPAGECLTVSVAINGLPGSCPRAYSENSCFAIDDAARLLIHYTGALSRKSDIVISALIKEDRGSPYDQFYIIVYGKPQRTGTKKKIARLKRIFADSPDRATFIQSDAGDDKVEIWRVPPGVDPPRPQ